uniref:Potassium calcium-activated channel subfamily N member 4 n=1 Tax=Pelodiscus sinensis TaxID=13735 RepID=K7FM58_PELSI
QIFMLDNSLQDWRIAMSGPRLGLILLELLVCALHPFPMGGSPCLGSEQGPSLLFLSGAETLLSLLMFLRLYLVPRAALLLSRVLGQASYRSIGSLKQIPLPAPMHWGKAASLWPKCIVGKQPVYGPNALWESGQLMAQVHRGKAASLWPQCIVGKRPAYGPMRAQGPAWITTSPTLPQGVGCTALLVAVAADKPGVSRAGPVHQGGRGSASARPLPSSSAPPLQAAGFCHRHSRARAGPRARAHHRRLLAAIHRFREVRIRHRKLRDQVNALGDASKV